MSTSKSSGPLAGVKIVDLSTMISGPLTAMMLADQGADVIKVESPGTGDMMRHLGTRKNDMTAIYALHNRGKKSLVVDMKKAQGKEVFTRLVQDADVLIQNFRPGAMERLGFGYEDVVKINPSIIYVSIAGFGNDGPQANRRVYDNVIQAASGLASVQTDKVTGKPAIIKHLVCDKTTSYTAAQSICAALFARERGAGGQHITLSMLDTAIAFTWLDAAMDSALLDDDVTHLPTIASGYAALEFIDGYATTSIVSQSEFEGYMKVLGIPEMITDPRFKDIPSRNANSDEYKRIVTDRIKAMTLAEFLEGAIEHDVPASGLNTLDSVIDEPQIIHNETFVVRTHPVVGTIREARSAPRFSGTPIHIGDHAPVMGQHSDEIVESLGFNAAELRAAGIIA